VEKDFDAEAVGEMDRVMLSLLPRKYIFKHMGIQGDQITANLSIM
jgi:hypothetical protein